ncbi:hypothetical protein QWY31_13850 [Cytophagales bacterium LB-30]|uniref:Uncharacterized protein n=1 Tax=Shiella aurantiaca TaxID=3058365 RepID=A0ABT8F7W8_9BACT|nr:hypothetical protein [Shiella aurantiaca]MDN4166588.1 hypothetical protein [Shiella aurantiaca]
MKLVAILMVFFVQTAYGQIVNSVSPNRTGIYYYSVDSLIQKIDKKKAIERILIKADWSVIKDFPDTIRGIGIRKLDNAKDFKSRRLGDNEVLFKVNGLTIIRDEIKLSIVALERKNKETTYFADGVYVFCFKYLPETKTYTLTEIKSGIVL